MISWENNINIVKTSHLIMLNKVINKILDPSLYLDQHQNLIRTVLSGDPSSWVWCKSVVSFLCNSDDEQTNKPWRRRRRWNQLLKSGSKFSNIFEWKPFSSAGCDTRIQQIFQVVSSSRCHLWVDDASEILISFDCGRQIIRHVKVITLSSFIDWFMTDLCYWLAPRCEK